MESYLLQRSKNNIFIVIKRSLSLVAPLLAKLLIKTTQFIYIQQGPSHFVVQRHSDAYQVGGVL